MKTIILSSALILATMSFTACAIGDAAPSANQKCAAATCGGAEKVPKKCGSK
jgi:hypothetical protein